MNAKMKALLSLACGALVLSACSSSLPPPAPAVPSAVPTPTPPPTVPAPVPSGVDPYAPQRPDPSPYGPTSPIKKEMLVWLYMSKGEMGDTAKVNRVKIIWSEGPNIRSTSTGGDPSRTYRFYVLDENGTSLHSQDHHTVLVLVEDLGALWPDETSTTIQFPVRGRETSFQVIAPNRSVLLTLNLTPYFLDYCLNFDGACDLDCPKPNDPDCCYDEDRDGYGDPDYPVCPNSGIDCDDKDPEIYPGTKTCIKRTTFPDEG